MTSRETMIAQHDLAQFSQLIREICEMDTDKEQSLHNEFADVTSMQEQQSVIVILQTSSSGINRYSVCMSAVSPLLYLKTSRSRYSLDYMWL